MERKNAIKIYFRYFLLLISFLILFSSRSFAASDQDYFPMEQNKNNHFSEYDKTAIENRFDAENNYIFAYFSGYQAGYGERMKVFHILVVPKNSGITVYGEKNNNLYQFSLYGGGGTLANNMCYQYSILEQNWKYEYSDSLSTFQNLQSSNYNSNIDYVSNFQIMTNNTSSAKVVLIYDDGVSFPDEDTARQDMEKPDADDYFPSWDNKPTFDDSSVENALSSLFDIVDWGWNNIKNTIKGLGEFITDTMRWGLQKVIDTIRNKVDEIKNAIVNKLIEIWDKIGDVADALADFGETLGNIYDFFANPWDDSDFEYTLQHSDFYTIYTSIGDSLDSINDTFDSVNEPESFVIRYSTGFHPDNEPGFHFPTIEGEISFDWLIPLRIYYRPILWLVVIYEMVVYGFSTFGDVLQGRTGAK